MPKRSRAFRRFLVLRPTKASTPVAGFGRQISLEAMTHGWYYSKLCRAIFREAGRRLPKRRIKLPGSSGEPLCKVMALAQELTLPRPAPRYTIRRWVRAAPAVGPAPARSAP